jgi:hypothetical protein
MIKPKIARRINEKTLLVTVDIGADVNYGYGRRPDRTEIKPFKFSNDRPGFVQFWKRIEEGQAQHPRPQDIVNLGVEALTAALKKVSQGKLGRTRAQALLEAAQHSAGLHEGQESILFEVQRLLREGETNEESIKQAEQKMRH